MDEDSFEPLHTMCTPLPASVYDINQSTRSRVRQKNILKIKTICARPRMCSICICRRRRKSLGGGVNGTAWRRARSESDAKMNGCAPGPDGDSCSPTVAAAKQRRWRCATKTRRTAERTAAAAGKLTRVDRRHNTTEHALMSVYVCVHRYDASEPARIDRGGGRRVVCGNYRNTCPSSGSRPKRYRGYMIDKLQ